MSKEGLLVVDKPAGLTSHDVVARVRRLVGTRRVGHAGTLDPMATGVLVLGLGRATRLLGYLAGADKEYLATIRLGVTTSTDDAEGEVLETATRPWSSPALPAAMAALTGEIEQRPAAVSAVKVAGVRAYRRVRAGEQVELPARHVMVSVFELLAERGDCLDVRVVCSSGTYVRALARDLGTALGVGGHLTALRRTRVGAYSTAAAHSLDALTEELAVVPLSTAVAGWFPRRDVDEDGARLVRHGGRLPPAGHGPGPVAVFDPAGQVLALVEEHDGAARPLVVFAPVS